VIKFITLNFDRSGSQLTKHTKYISMILRIQKIMNDWIIPTSKFDYLTRSENIIDVCEIPQFRLVAASNLIKQLLFWNLDLKTLVRKIDLKGVSIHSLAYWHDFQVLAAASFANFIQLWSFGTEDIIPVGTLDGHCGQVVCIRALVDTPLLVSTDELGMIKTWDIRTRRCIQSFLNESRTVFKNIINIGNDYFVASEQRLTWFKFEKKAIVNANGITIDNNFPTDIDYNIEKEEIVISTKFDIRLIDAKTGKTNRILNMEESEIIRCKMYFDNKQIVVWKNNGEINMHSIENGDLMCEMIGHSGSVSDIYLDSTNKIIVTGGADSRILFQKEKESNSLIRMQNKAHLKSEITILDCNQETLGKPAIVQI